jgi:hypothetical protein
MRKKFNPTPTFLPAALILLLFWWVLAALAFWLSPKGAVSLTWIICLTGNIVGIPLGMFASPLQGEGSHFRVLGSWIATFFSGYLVSKLDLLDTAQLLADDLSIGRTLLFGAFLILGAVQAFVLRSYMDSIRLRDSFVVPDQALPSVIGEQAA